MIKVTFSDGEQKEVDMEKGVEVKCWNSDPDNVYYGLLIRFEKDSESPFIMMDNDEETIEYYDFCEVKYKDSTYITMNSLPNIFWVQYDHIYYLISVVDTCNNSFMFGESFLNSRMAHEKGLTWSINRFDSFRSFKL